MGNSNSEFALRQGIVLPTLTVLQLPKFWIAATILLICAISARLAYLAFFHPLSQYPGPRLWAISRLPWAWHVIRGDIWEPLDRFHDQYGPIVRIAPDELTYISPDAWKEIYATRPQLLKDPRSQTPPLNGADSLFTAVGDDHRRIRGAFINAFSDKALRDQSTLIENYSGQFIERLKAELVDNPSHVVNIQRIIGYAAFDIISDLTWGESPKALRMSGDHNWIHRFFLHAQFSTVRNCLTRFSPLDKILSYFFLRITSKQRIANAKLTSARIDRRLAAGHTRSDFMTPIIGKISEDGRKGITKNEVLTNGLAAVIANSQLSTIAMTTATYLLLQYPHHFQHLAKEIRNAGFEHETDIKVSSTQSLPYLDAVINEALRLHHPTPGSLPRIAPKDGLVIGGKYVPGGTVVGVNLHNVHNRSENFYKPREFHPERFLGKNDPRYSAVFEGDRKEAFQPFSMGPRNCIGAKVFLAEARVVLARLIWTFDMLLAEPEALTWLDQKAWLVFEPKPLRVKLYVR
ncbi:Uncharacterized protein BP5553_00025 [Venustampulla echinocandica]|uniref:Cytochrome P450 n=1 Tax=Venustampulla echinocandica TaxID=2656787 RepID=A0A370TWY8_9HELO|nr:Uncharacterized protein BP5553_00025 [Venustampulla echinocandica]RDL40046.1 Uncharacterized protein BP5553_00025 [Venustampulla echinocandica]